MKSVNFFLIFLLFLAACAVVPSQKEEVKPPSGNQFMENPSFCNVDSDCTCGGMDKNTDKCFVGNKLYAAKNVDFAKDCPDFCTGIGGNLETKCVEHVCKTVRIVTPAEPKKPAEEPVFCTQDAKQCPDGSYVARVAPNCEFAPCPTGSQGSTGLSTAHWLCEDGSWAQNAEGCFENTCIAKSDCQLMGIKSPCGPYLIPGPTKTLHKPPIYYADRCGTENCVAVEPECSGIVPLATINGFDCDANGKCIVRTIAQK